jgi:hypothetical protein
VKARFRNTLHLAAAFVLGALLGGLSAWSHLREPEVVRATIHQVCGDVSIRRSGGSDWTPASPGDDLYFGDALSTGHSGTASVRLADGEALEVPTAASLTFHAP